MRFDRVGVFTYSDEEGTPANDLPNKIDPKIAKQRRTRLMKEQSRISRRRNKARVGETVRVIFEGESNESELLWQGRMEEIWKGGVHSIDESTAIYFIFECGGACGWKGIDGVRCSCIVCDEACVDEAWVPERADE